MKNRIISIITVIMISSVTLSSGLHFVMAEDNVITNETSNSVNTLSINEQKEQVAEELQKAEEQLSYVQGELSESIIQIQELDDRIQGYQEKLDEVNSKYQEPVVLFCRQRRLQAQKILKTQQSAAGCLLPSHQRYLSGKYQSPLHLLKCVHVMRLPVLQPAFPLHEPKFRKQNRRPV